jgi:uncharacterized membrane protein YhaH (DUF805 family)
MADIFISYAREDAARAQTIARALEASGYDVFWDREIPPGLTWADFLEQKIGAAKRVLVLWSAASTQSQWVREEARMGRDSGKLIPVMLDGVQPPFGFGEVQAANLSDWNGRTDHPAWARLDAALRAALGMPAAPPRPAADFSAAAAPAHRSPLEHVQHCIRLYADGKGRARRTEYWWFAAFQAVMIIAASVADMITFGHDYNAGDPNYIGAVVWLALLCPAVAVTARRFHDVGLNGWLVALGYAGTFVYGLGALFLLGVALWPGQAKTNAYGPDPRAA